MNYGGHRLIFLIVSNVLHNRTAQACNVHITDSAKPNLVLFFKIQKRKEQILSLCLHLGTVFNSNLNSKYTVMIRFTVLFRAFNSIESLYLELGAVNKGDI